MNVTQFLRNEQLANDAKMAVATSATLTAAQLGAYKTFVLADGIEVTLPAASAAYNGMVRRIVAGGATAKISVDAGFGGGGASYDHASLTIGDAAEVYCGGDYWFLNSVTTAAAT